MFQVLTLPVLMDVKPMRLPLPFLTHARCSLTQDHQPAITDNNYNRIRYNVFAFQSILRDKMKNLTNCFVAVKAKAK